MGARPRAVAAEKFGLGDEQNRAGIHYLNIHRVPVSRLRNFVVVPVGLDFHVRQATRAAKRSFDKEVNGSFLWKVRSEKPRAIE